MAEINIHSERFAGASSGSGGFSTNMSNDALGRGISDLSRVAGSLITAGIKSARTDRISRSILALSELQAGWQADGMGTNERGIKTRKYITQLDMSASDKMAIRQGASVRQLKSQRLADGSVAQIDEDTNEIIGRTSGEYTRAVDSFAEQNNKMAASAVNGVAAWNTGIGENLRDNTEGAQANKVKFQASYMEATNGVFDYMDRREAHKIFIGTRGDPILGTDIKEEYDSRAGEWKRRVSVLRQHVTSRFIAESANNDKNTISVSNVEQMWKGMMYDITARLTPNFLREAGISYEDAITILNNEDAAVTTWSKEIFKRGTAASAVEKHGNATKVLEAQFLFEAKETRAGFKKTNKALYDLLIKNEIGVLKAMVNVSVMMGNTGQRGGLKRVIREFTDPFTKQFLESAIHTLNTTKGEKGTEWLIDLMSQIQDNSMMAALPDMVSKYESTIKKVIAGVRETNEGAADILQEKFNRYSTANKHNTLILQGIGGS